MTDWIRKYPEKLKYSLLVSACLAIYVLCLNFGFIWDDYTYIVKNYVLDQKDALVTIWTTNLLADFWPLSYSFLWFQKQLYGNNAFGFHVANLLVFILTVILVYKLLKELNFKSAFVLALIYAVHPMNVEAVVWVFQAKTNLANCFGLASLIFWIDFVQNKKRSSYAFALLMLLASYLSKISLIGLPILMFFYSHNFDSQKRTLKHLMVLSPFFFFSVVIGLVNIFWDTKAFQTPISETILEPDYLFRFALIGKTFLFYLFKTFFPWPLMFAHPRWHLDLNNLATFLPSAFLFFVLAFFAFKFLRKEKINSLLSGALVSFLILFPVLGFAEIYFMRFSYVAEHWLTIGMLGFLFPVIDFFYSKRFFKYFISLYIAILATVSVIYIQEYSSEKRLLESSLAKNPNSQLPHSILGLIYKGEKNFEKAMFHFRKSIEIQPNAQSYFNIALIYEAANNFEDAKQNYLKAIELNPYLPMFYNNLGGLYARNKEYETAIKYFKMAIDRDLGSYASFYNIGLAYELLNQKNEAIDWYKKAARLDPTNPIYQDAVRRLNQ